MQMIPSADAIGQTECDASRAIGARTFATPVAFTHAATLGRASGSGSESWKTRVGKFLAKWTICSPEPLAISRMTPVLGKTSRRTSRMKSRLRSVAGAYWRSSLIVLTHSGNFGHRIADAARDVANGQRAPSAIRALFRAGVDHVMDYRTECFEARARQIPGGRKVELAIGGDLLKVIAHTCRPAGSGCSEYPSGHPTKRERCRMLSTLASAACSTIPVSDERQQGASASTCAYGTFVGLRCDESGLSADLLRLAPPATKL